MSRRQRERMEGDVYLDIPFKFSDHSKHFLVSLHFEIRIDR